MGHVGSLAHSPLGLQWMSGIVRNDSDLQKSTPNHKSGCVSEGRNVPYEDPDICNITSV